MSKEKPKEKGESLWTKDLSQLWANRSWKHYIPWEEKVATPERSNATARLVIYATLVALLLRRNIKYIKYGFVVLFTLYVLEGRTDDENEKNERTPEEEAMEAEVEVAGGIFDHEGINYRVNTVPELSALVPDVIAAREKQYRPPKIPTKAEQIYGTREARKSHSNMKDSLYEPNRAGSQRYQSKRGNFSV